MPRPLLGPMLSLGVAVLAVWHSDLASPSALDGFFLPLLAVFAGLYTLMCGQPCSDEECGLSAHWRRTDDDDATPGKSGSG